MTSTKATVHVVGMGYIAYIAPKEDRSVFTATLGAVVQKDGVTVKTPVFIGEYLGSTPGQALDALLASARRVYEREVT